MKYYLIYLALSDFKIIQSSLKQSFVNNISSTYLVDYYYLILIILKSILILKFLINTYFKSFFLYFIQLEISYKLILNLEQLLYFIY